jgi:hypothetical protein
MSNKKLIVGIAAGAAALAVVAVLLKRKGYLDGVIERAEGFGGDIADKYQDVKEAARKKFDEVKQKGGEIADKVKSSYDSQSSEGEDASSADNSATV